MAGYSNHCLEIALFDKVEGNLFAYEMKWKDKPNAPPNEWQQAYGDKAEWKIVPPANALKSLNITS